MWEDEYEAGDRVVLHLEPGLAFGTGTHANAAVLGYKIPAFLRYPTLS